MKKRITVSIMTLCAIVLLVGCAGVPMKVKVPALEKAPVYELDGLYLTTDPKQMTGVARDHIKLGVGETVVIYARGKSTIETGGKWFELPADVVVDWKTDSELEVTPTTGHMVTVKLIKSLNEGSAFAKAVTTTKDGKKIDAIFMVREKK